MLSKVAPGTTLRQGLENILRARTGALIVLGDSPEIMEIVEGGFLLDTEFNAAALYELAKMDGAIILNQEGSKILRANVHLVPQPTIPSQETGIRHRIAERVARQTGAMVIAISQRRNVITLFKGPLKYVVRDIGLIQTKANQAIQTLDKYKHQLDRALANLTYLELENTVTVHDVVSVIQRLEIVMRIIKEIELYVVELGNEGRLISMQLEELSEGVKEEGLLLVRDYLPAGEKTEEQVSECLHEAAAEEVLDLLDISRILGYGGTLGSLDFAVTPRGFRVLKKIPRLPMAVIENLVNKFETLQGIIAATVEELDEVEGIGEVRARAIRDGLRKLKENIWLYLEKKGG
ncbi:DNA integrity scanning protein DisA [Calderihabitans maritimus]|uniref:DNA integrity scanning protein DisA n=2 Tax=Calderihabitans maritimus TaxID=1246530 RepID=A0A1Z5HP93_9FIRM|nr:DNA integrity scanning protein DisA [Calderihabitans maritimus]